MTGFCKLKLKTYKIYKILFLNKVKAYYKLIMYKKVLIIFTLFLLNTNCKVYLNNKTFNDNLIKNNEIFFNKIFEKNNHIQILIINQNLSNLYIENLVNIFLSKKTINLLNLTINNNNNDNNNMDNCFNLKNNLINLWLNNYLNGNIIITNSSLINSTIDCLINTYDNYLLLIINDNNLNIDREFIYNIFIKNWQQNRAIKFKILFNNHLYFFKPFLYNNIYKKYGMIFNYDAQNLTELNMLENFTNLNGYPVRAEIFPSAFILPVLNKQKSNLNYTGGIMQQFIGVDANVVNILINLMNFTRK